MAGAGVGALLGSAVAGRGDRTTGAVIGGVGGAIVGNQLTKPNADCAHAYGYYDRNGLWHANAVDRANARGYYDRDGAWIDGAPNGYYDAQGRWTAADSGASSGGYYTSSGRWVPASAGGYYDIDGRWVAGAASGYYTREGRWIAGPATGRYDRDGRWISGEAAGRHDANGVWVADPQPGYYDADRRWRAGPAVGYYDTQGRWIATAPSAQGYRTDVVNQDRANRAEAPRDIRARQDWLERRIRHGVGEGFLTRQDGNRALRSLNGIRRQEASMRHYHGRLGVRDEATIQAKLDNLSASLRWSGADNRRQY